MSSTENQLEEENEITEDDNTGSLKLDDGGDNNPWIWTTIIASLTALYFLVKNKITERKYKKEREKNVLYQEAIIKHQAEIEILKTEKEREEYKNRLWEEILSSSEDNI